MASAGAVTALQRCMVGNSMQAPAHVSGASKTQNRGKRRSAELISHPRRGRLESMKCRLHEYHISSQQQKSHTMSGPSSL